MAGLFFSVLATTPQPTALDLSVSSSEIESLRSLLLGQLSELEGLKRGLSERTRTIDALERSLRQQSELLSQRESSIDDLQRRLRSSSELTESLRLQLEETRHLSGELKRAHSELSRSFASYRAEAELQLRTLRAERDRERAAALFWKIAGGTALAAAAALIAFDLATAR